jgi:hypothetical protein
MAPLMDVLKSNEIQNNFDKSLIFFIKSSLPPQLRDFTHIDRVRAVNLPQAIGFADKSLECEHCHEKGHRASQCNWSGSVVRGQDGRQYRTGGRFGGQFCFCCFGHGWNFFIFAFLNLFV